MPHSLTFYPEDHLIVVCYTGEILIQELKDVREEIFNHPDFDKVKFGVSDFRKAIKKILPSEFSDFVTQIKNNQTNIKWSLLNSTPLETSLSLLFKNGLEETPRIGVFTTLNAASDYLGLDLSKHLTEHHL